MDQTDRLRAILDWQNALEETFSYQGIVGGRLLLPQEGGIGQHFIKTYHGHRVLIDSFFGFFAQTLSAAFRTISFGWLCIATRT